MVGIWLELAQPVDDPLGGLLRRDGDEVRGHQPAGGLLDIGEQLSDVARLLGLHEAQQLRLALLGEVRQEVGSVIGSHLLEDVRRRLGWQGLEDVDLVLRRQFLDHVRGALVVERSEDACAIAGRQLLHDVRDVGRVERRQRGVRDTQLERADAGLHGVDLLPLDVILDGEAERSSEPLAGTGETQPAQDTGQANVNRNQPQAAAHRRELDVVDPNDLSPFDVDDLLVEQVQVEADLVGPLLEDGDVDARCVQARTRLVEPEKSH